MPRDPSKGFGDLERDHPVAVAAGDAFPAASRSETLFVQTGSCLEAHHGVLCDPVCGQASLDGERLVGQLSDSGADRERHDRKDEQCNQYLDQRKAPSDHDGGRSARTRDSPSE